MKKMYGAPKAEKVEFDYSDAVVASTSPCNNWTTMGDTATNPCTENPKSPTSYSD